MLEKFERMLETRASPGDTRDEDGILICGVCGKPKEKVYPCPETLDPSGYKRMPILCDCEIAAREEEQQRLKERAFRERLAALRKDGLHDATYLSCTFAMDDGANPEATAYCKRYADNFSKMLDSGTGLMLYGSVGTGKSFLASCIANEVINQLHPATVTSLPALISFVHTSESSVDLSALMRRYELMVIDDLGAERNTGYSNELIFALLDARLRAKLPTVITTNLTPAELKKPAELSKKRIYERVIELCPLRVAMNGESRRETLARKRAEEAMKIMGG